MRLEGVAAGGRAAGLLAGCELWLNGPVVSLCTLAFFCALRMSLERLRQVSVITTGAVADALLCLRAGDGLFVTHSGSLA